MVARPGLALLLAAACLAAPAATQARSSVNDGAVRGRGTGATPSAIFYYPWYGTPALDGGYQHWQQNGNTPPTTIAANFFPARGTYSSTDELVLAAQMTQISAAGVGQVIVSWWGRGSVEAARLPAVVAAARSHGLAVGVHIEPYVGRTVASVGDDIAEVRQLGISDVYLYGSTELADIDWSELNRSLSGLRTFANTPYAARAWAGGFTGLYTYDVLTYDGSSFPRMCEQARRLRILCAPSVGPGYDARRATPDVRVKPRRDGATYDAMWRSALRAKADLVTITSFNEWHEGTQIEPAKPVAGYASYAGAYGPTGVAARNAYLERTGYWTSRAGVAASRRS